MTEHDPKEVGISVLKALLQENQAATPENYRLFYNRIYGLETAGSESGISQDWGSLLKEFLCEWDRSQAGLSHLQKIQQRNEMLALKREDLLYTAMAQLVQRWKGLATRPSSDSATRVEDTPLLHQVWTRALRSGFAVPLRGDAEGLNDLESIDQLLATSGDAVEDLIPLLRKLWERLDRAEAKKDRVQEIYQRALDLLFSGSAELCAKDPWFSEQLKILHKAFHQEPTSVQQAQELLSGLTELLYRQEQRRAPVSEMDQALQDLLQLVFQYVEALTEGSSDTYNEFVRLSTEIERSDDPQHIRGLVATLIERSRSLQDMLRESRDALRQARSQLEAARGRVRNMEEEISQLNLLVHEDPLTHLLNRRGLHLAFERETARADRHNLPFSIAILDLDHFKKINDRHGHETGDQVLRHFSALLRQSLRAEDSVARYGGEEFVILMPGTRSELAVQILGRLQENLRNHPLVNTKQAQIRVSFSAGIAAWQSGVTLDAVLLIADQALYRAKQEGRERIYLGMDPQASRPA